VNPRDNKKGLILLGLIILAGGVYLGYTLFLVPLDDYGRDINRLHKANADKRAEVLQILRDKGRLKQWQTLSLPGVENLPRAKPRPGEPPVTAAQDRETAILHAQGEYTTYLRNLLARHILPHNYEFPRKDRVDARGVGVLANKVPIYTALTFKVEARGKWANFVALVKEFQGTPLLHRIRNLNVKHGDAKSTEPLVLTMTVEALIIHGATKRGPNLMIKPSTVPAAVDTTLMALRARPTHLGALPWAEVYALGATSQRNFADLAHKNIFEGPKPPVVVKGPTFTPPREGLSGGIASVKIKPDNLGPPKKVDDLISFTHLTGVTVASGPAAATVFDRSTDRLLVLRDGTTENTIPLLRSGEGKRVVIGKAVSIDTRGVIFHLQLDAQKPAQSVPNPYRDRTAIYRLPPEEAVELYKSKTVKIEEVDGLYRLHRAYWDGMALRDKVVTMGKAGEFSFRHDLIHGRVVKRDSTFVVIALRARYAGVREEGSALARPNYHQGYCFLGLGEKLSQALRSPLTDQEVEELKQFLAARTASLCAVGLLAGSGARSYPSIGYAGCLCSRWCRPDQVTARGSAPQPGMPPR
jgi:hypothetical protein